MDRDRELREELVAHMQRTRTLHDPNVAAAFLAVPRHRFVPSELLNVAYEDRALSLKEHEGFVLSSISQPGMVAQMLEMLEVRPGQRFLEIGTGSGYNAALLSVLTGPQGQVVSVELESDLAERARSLLDEMGYTNVVVRSGDAECIHFDDDFDGIVVTARTDDIAGVWWEALKNGGRLVVPLNIAYGGERVVAFVRDGSRLCSVGTQACSFIGMRAAENDRGGDIFFRNTATRYAPEPNARTPLSITAIRRDDVRADLLETADVVIARPETFFAVTALESNR